MTAERETVVEIRFPYDADSHDVVQTLCAIERSVERGAMSERWSDGTRWEIRRPIVPPENACRMCGSRVAWSPLCSACCGVVERVEEAIASAGGTVAYADIADRLAYGPRGRPRQRRLDARLIPAAIMELSYRGKVGGVRGSWVRLIPTEAA